MTPNELYQTLKSVDPELPGLMSVIFGSCEQEHCACRQSLRAQSESILELIAKHKKVSHEALNKAVKTVLENPNVSLLMNCEYNEALVKDAGKVKNI
ncbi:MAG: hypothetical protein GJ680_21135 [Alteromonadaceae bacterium]|nr:hypothetical protein [Alteromonadaceae bacterium]